MLGLKVVEEVARGVSDGIVDNGLSRGYSSWRFENGDMIFSEWQNINQTVVQTDKSRKSTTSLAIPPSLLLRTDQVIE